MRKITDSWNVKGAELHALWHLSTHACDSNRHKRGLYSPTFYKWENWSLERFTKYWLSFSLSVVKPLGFTGACCCPARDYISQPNLRPEKGHVTEFWPMGFKRKTMLFPALSMGWLPSKSSSPLPGMWRRGWASFSTMWMRVTPGLDNWKGAWVLEWPWGTSPPLSELSTGL